MKLLEVIGNGRKSQGHEMHGSEMKLKNTRRNKRKDKKMIGN